MKVINLRLHYPHCQQDKLVEVSEALSAGPSWRPFFRLSLIWAARKSRRF